MLAEYIFLSYFLLTKMSDNILASEDKNESTESKEKSDRQNKIKQNRVNKERRKSEDGKTTRPNWFNETQRFKMY